MRPATGVDDPALAETMWPIPDQTTAETQDRLTWRPDVLTRVDLVRAESIMSAYRAPICDGTTEEQTKRLAALRRVWKKRNS